MKIVCPNCTTSYEVAAASIGEAGRSVRCVHCRSIWFVSAETVAAEAAAVSAPAAAAAPAPADDMSLEDMAAWGLSDDPPAPAATAGWQDPADGAPAADEPAFDANAMLNDIEGPIALSGAPPIAPVDAWPVDDDESWMKPDGDEQPFQRPGDKAKQKRKLKLKVPSLSTIAMIQAAVLVALVIWRGDVVRVMPQTASLYATIGLPVNLRGLAIEDVQSAKEVQDGIAVLVIDGRIVNRSRMLLEVPRVRLALRNGAGGEVYNWTALPSRPVLGPGDDQPFRTRLASPPGDGKDVLVRFFNRRDAVGGLK
jgi:predicted Zn finger-like uncharacterized protein